MLCFHFPQFLPFTLKIGAKSNPDNDLLQFLHVLQVEVNTAINSVENQVFDIISIHQIHSTFYAIAFDNIWHYPRITLMFQIKNLLARCKTWENCNNKRKALHSVHSFFANYTRLTTREMHKKRQHLSVVIIVILHFFNKIFTTESNTKYKIFNSFML